MPKKLTDSAEPFGKHRTGHGALFSFVEKKGKLIVKTIWQTQIFRRVRHTSL
jgi:hypothetical protein